MEFDQEGNLLQAWGGPGAGYDWPKSEHGIFVDKQERVWLGGNDKDNDHMMLQFTRDGRFVMQIGKAGKTEGSNSQEYLGRPAMAVVDEATDELYVADGYKNKRVIVFDAKTGQYRRHWGAYGATPDDADLGAYDPAAPRAKQFRNPVHCVRIARDGLVYVCDRVNDRIQVFHKDGTFVKEFILEPATRWVGSVWDIALSEDAGAEVSVRDRRHQQRDPHRVARDRRGAQQLRPRRTQRRPVPLGAHHGDRLARQSLHRRCRYRQAGAEVQACG